MERDEQGEEISARCGVRAARVAHAASTKGMKKGEGNRENQKGIHVDTEKEIVTTERADNTKRRRRMQLVKEVEGNREGRRK